MTLFSDSAELGRVFHALDDPSRRAILEKLSEGPISISSLAEPLHITLAAVVQHVNVLEESGLVQTEKVGRVRTCSTLSTQPTPATQQPPTAGAAQPGQLRLGSQLPPPARQ